MCCTDVAISASASAVRGSWWLLSCVGSGYAGVPSSYLLRVRVRVRASISVRVRVGVRVNVSVSVQVCRARTLRWRGCRPRRRCPCRRPPALEGLGVGG